MPDESKKYRNESWLRSKYRDKGLNLKEIGGLVGVSGDTILRWMKKHGIERRPTGGEVAPSRNECIEALQRVADELEKSPTRKEYENASYDDEPRLGSFRTRFDSWNTAKEVAGLSPCVTGPDGFSEEECVRALRQVANSLDKSPSQREYNEVVGEESPSAANIKHQFTSWNAAKSNAGLEIIEKHGWTKSEVADSISRVHEQCDGQFSKRTYSRIKQTTDPSVDTITRLFGSWNQALDNAGIVPQPSQYTEEDCIKALQYVAEELGRSPRIREYRSHRRPTDPVPWVMKNSFESWNDMKELADLYTYDDGSYLIYPYGSDWRRTAEQVRERDDNKCRSCDLTSEKHIERHGRDLEVHHLHKIMSFFDSIPDKLKKKMSSGESISETEREVIQNVVNEANDLTNLVTVCKECHSNLETLPVQKQIGIVNATFPEVHPQQ